MSDFAVPPVEQSRLAFPNRQSILEALPGKTFSRITSLAAQLFKVPFTLVSLVDQERPYVKAFQGLTFEQAEAALAFCACLPGSLEIMTVPDTWQDECFKAHPLVTQAPYICSFAAIPLRTEAGLTLGTLALFDQQPRAFTQELGNQLIDLAALVMEPLEAGLAAQVAKGKQENPADINRHKTAEEALKKSEEQYRTLARNIPNSVVYMFDQDLRYILAEGAILSQEQIGYTKEDLEGKTIWEVLPPALAEELAPIYQKALNGQETIFEGVYGGRTYQIHALPAKNEKGEIYSGLILSQDITERKQVEDRLQTNEASYRELYLTASRQAQELALLHKVRNTLSWQMGLPYLFKTVVEETSRELGYPSVSLLLRQGDKIKLNYQIGYELSFTEQPISAGVTGRVIRTGQAAFVADAKLDPDFIGDREGQVTMISIPLFDQDQVVGALNVLGSATKILTEADFHLLETLGEFVSLAIHRARLFMQVSEKEERLQTVIRNAPVVLYTFDPQGIFTLSEGKGLQALNLRPGEVVGRSVFEVYGHNPALLGEIRRALAGETFNTLLEEAGAAFESYYSPVKNEKGEVTSVIGLSINISEKREAEKALKAERDFALQIMRNMGQGLAVFKPDFTIDFANPAFAKMGGYSPEEIIGKTPFDLLPPDFQPNLAELPWERLREQSNNIETDLVRKDGSLFFAHISTEPIYRDGELAGIVGVISDLTEQKRVEQQLRLALEKEKELSEIKNKLITTASHEFRTPLSAIISSTELLEYYNHKWSEEKKSEILGRISQSANKLTSLVEDILTYNRAEDGKLEYKPSRLELTIFCRNLLDHLQLSSGDNKAIRLTEVGSKQEAYLDEKLLSYILNNLLSNAVKYTAPDGQIELDIEWQPEQVVLRVKDDGIGIPLKDQANLFEPFQRASNVGTVGGTGFGLAIVKRSVLVHNGSIKVESAEGQGTTFTVTLPLKDVSNDDKLSATGLDRERVSFLPSDQEVQLESIIDQRWLLEQAIEASSSGFIISNPRQENNPIVYVSKGFERLTGFLSEEVLGKSGQFLEGEDQDQAALAELYQAIAEERGCRVVLRNYHKDGHLLWIELQLSPVRNQAGKLLYFVGIQNDVSDRIRAEAALNQSEQKFKALVENSPDIIARFDRNGRYLYINPTIEKITKGHLKAEQVTGRTIAEVEYLAPRLINFKDHLTQVFGTGKATSFEFTPNLPDEKPEYFQVRFVPEFSSDGKEVISVLTIGRNITDLKRANETLLAIPPELKPKTPN